MKRLLVLALLISLGLNAGLAVRLLQADRPTARAGRDRPERMMPAPGDSQAWHARMERRMDRMAERLGLDPDQRQALRAHRQKVEGEIRARFQGLEAARAGLRAEAERRPPDPAAVAAALAAVGRAEAELDSLVAANLQAELELLNPEQQARMLRMMPFERLGGDRMFGGGRGEGEGPGHGRRHGGDQDGPRRPGGE